jgi:endoribonuclease Dicer
MRDCVAPCIHQQLPTPRILGLTASFVNGSTRNSEKKRRDLEGLLQSTIFAPDVAARITPERFLTVKYTVQDIDDEKQVVQDLVQKAIVDVNVKEVKKVISRCVHVFEELGTYALLFYVERIIVQQIKEKASAVASLGDERSVNCAQKIYDALPAIQIQINELLHHLKGDSLLNKSNKSTKLERLEKLIAELFTTNKEQRGIIFVEQVALVSSLAMQLNRAFRGVLKCGAVAGNGYQTENDRQEQLDRFKCGDVQILVATAALEEGIDVADCAFVVRYSIMRTTKAHIQGAGRARHPNAMIFYFENDAILEKQKEAHMRSVAKNQALSLKEEDLQESVRRMSITIKKRHPFPFTSSQDGSGEVNVFNCKQIFFRYCSIVLCASISPEEHLYEFTTMDDGTRLLSRIRYPTSTCWIYVDVAECREFWAGVNMDIIFQSERSKTKSQLDKHEMQCVYVVVVELRKRNLLDNHNMPNNLNSTEVRKNCPLEESLVDEFAIKNNIFQSYVRHEVPVEGREVNTRSIPCSVSTISIDSFEKNS